MDWVEVLHKEREAIREHSRAMLERVDGVARVTLALAVGFLLLLISLGSWDASNKKLSSEERRYERLKKLVRTPTVGATSAENLCATVFQHPFSVLETLARHEHQRTLRDVAQLGQDKDCMKGVETSGDISSVLTQISDARGASHQCARDAKKIRISASQMPPLLTLLWGDMRCLTDPAGTVLHRRVLRHLRELSASDLDGGADESKRTIVILLPRIAERLKHERDNLRSVSFEFHQIPVTAPVIDLLLWYPFALFCLAGLLLSQAHELRSAALAHDALCRQLASNLGEGPTADGQRNESPCPGILSFQTRLGLFRLATITLAALLSVAGVFKASTILRSYLPVYSYHDWLRLSLAAAGALALVSLLVFSARPPGSE